MKKALSLVMATVLATSFASVSVFAANNQGKYIPFGYASGATKYATDDDGVAYDTNEKAGLGTLTFDVQPDNDIYLVLDSGTINGVDVSARALADDDIFKLDVDKDGNGKGIVKSVKQIQDKKINGVREQVLEIKLNDSTTTDDLKADLDLTLKVKSSSDAKDEFGTTDYEKVSGEELVFNVVMWINNEKKEGDDADAEAGDAIYFSATDNETNTITWGDDIAFLKFDANDDASDFYAKLSTKSDSDIYATYGDPVNAELWFYDFVGHPTIDSTSRATLTLGIPWDDDDDDFVPNPEDCFVYEVIDGELVDVTDKFTYSEDATDIEGWTTKTRTLGTYVVSDTELDLDVADDVSEAPEDGTSDGDKEIPNTGSSDAVNVAVAAGIISLAAAGALAFKKSAK